MERKVGVVIAILTASAVRGLLGVIHPDPLTDVVAPSGIVASIGFPPVASVTILSAYVVISLVFHLVHGNLTDGKVKRGLIFGIVFRLLWWYRTLEGSLEMGVSFIKELVFGACEIVPKTVLSVLLSINAKAPPVKPSAIARVSLSKTIVPFIALFYTIGRYVMYSLFGISTGYPAYPVFTMAWVFGHGVLIGLMYLVFKSWTFSSSSLRNALFFYNRRFLTGLDGILRLCRRVVRGFVFGNGPAVYRYCVCFFGVISFFLLSRRGIRGNGDPTA